MPDVSVVSACDRNFLWGAYILASSKAKFLPDVPLILLAEGFTEEDRRLIEQFPNTRIVEVKTGGGRRGMNNRKAEALLNSDHEYIAWVDADCMFIGDVSELLVPANGQFQIRMRGAAENAMIWRPYYSPDEIRQGIPGKILDQWRNDVGQRDLPRHATTCVTNAFVLHRRHLDFVREWQAQIDKVLSPQAGVVDTGSSAYFMTDESVMSSLLAFSEIAPEVSEFRLDREAHRHIAHFGANPKPWKRWQKHLWYCNAPLLDVLDWVRREGYASPPVPWSLRRSSRLPAYLLAGGEGFLRKAKHRLVRVKGRLSGSGK